jgi:hypothetical protein
LYCWILYIIYKRLHASLHAEARGLFFLERKAENVYELDTWFIRALFEHSTDSYVPQLINDYIGCMGVFIVGEYGEGYLFPIWMPA